MGLRGAEIDAAIAAAVGMVLTITLLPEPKGKSLGQLGPPVPQLSPAVCRSTPVTDGYFCRHESSRAICASLALSTR